MLDYEDYWDVRSNPCLSCHQPKKKIVRLTEQGRLTRTEIFICQNKNCQRFIDIEKISTWIIKSPYHYGRDFQTGNRIEYRPHLTKRKKSKALLKAENF